MDQINLYKTYLERLRDIREDRDLTQSDVANHLSISQRTYSDYESGKIRMPFDVILDLAQFYNISLAYISGYSNEKWHFPV